VVCFRAVRVAGGTGSDKNWRDDKKNTKERRQEKEKMEDRIANLDFLALLNSGFLQQIPALLQTDVIRMFGP
jgi:hypothetical protein